MNDWGAKKSMIRYIKSQLKKHWNSYPFFNNFINLQYNSKKVKLNTMDLSKSDKKTARILMDKGILKEKEICNASVLEILENWKNGKIETSETYGKVYQTVKKNDKYIGLHYDGISGSRYFVTVLNLYCKGLISEEEINLFSETVRERLKALKEELL